jgi:hypothetical protein
MSIFSRKVARFVSLSIAVGAIVAWAGPARAYYYGDCYVVFAAANVAKVTPVRINAGGADFGDLLHIGGVPQGNAVICWSTDGRVAVKGLLFADNFRGPVSSTSRIKFRRSNGSWTTEFPTVATTQGGWPGWTLAYVVSPPGDFRRVRIVLTTTTTSGAVSPPFAKSYNR